LGGNIIKRVGILALVLVAVLLTGCLSPKITFSILPKTINISFDTEEVELKAEVKMSGFGSYIIEQAALELLDEEGESVLKEPKVYTVNQKVTVVPIGSVFKPQVPIATLRLADVYAEILDGQELTEDLYNSELKGRIYTLKITLMGTTNPSAEATLEFK